MNRHHLFLSLGRGGRACLLVAIALAGSLATAASVRPAPVLVDARWIVPGDFDGDGVTDLAHVDSHTGAIEMWYGRADGGWTPGAPGPSGLAGVAHAAAARLVTTTRDDLVLTNTFGNALVIRPGSARGVEPAPVRVAVADLGPVHVAGLGPGRTAGYGDLVVHTTLDYSLAGVGGPNRLRTYGRVAGTFTSASLTPDSPIRPDATLAVVGLAGLDLGDGNPAWLGAHLRHPNFVSARLDLLQVVVGAAPTLVQQVALDASAGWTAGRFGPAARPGLLTWAPGPSNFSYRAFASEPAPGGWPVANTVPLPFAVSEVVVVAEGDPGLLLLLRSDSQLAQLGQFDGATFTPVGAPLEATFNRYLGAAVALGNGRFSIADRDYGAGQDPNWRTYGTAGGGPTLLDERALTGIPAGAARANVLLFAGDPLDPLTGGELRELRRVGDWTQEANPTGGALAIRAQVDRGLPLGLAAEVEGFGGGVPAGVTHALPNQLTAQVSLAPRGPAEGVPTPRVTLNPAPGRYPAALRAEPVAPWPGAVLRVRRGQNNWANYNPAAPLVVTESTTIMAYAIDPVTGRPSAITTAEYIITQPDRERDSDGDGVPDFVELWYGLDAQGSGRDGDGDGMSDLREILLGSDPSDGASIADDQFVPAFAERSAFDLRVTLAAQQPGGAAAAREAPAAGLAMVVRGSTGERRVGRSTVTGGTSAEVHLTGVPYAGAQGLPWLVARSEAPRFVLAGEAPDRFRGVELLALVDDPGAEALALPWTADTGRPLANEVEQWRAAASFVYLLGGAPVTQSVEATADPTDTLVVALLEQVLAELAVEGGHRSAGDAPFTLVPDRPGEAGRVPLEAELLTALSRPRSLLVPAWRPEDVLTALRATLADAEGALAPWRQLNHEFHLAAAADPIPGKAAVPLPLDRLRAVFETPVASAGEDEGEIDEALAAFVAWRKSLEPRPVAQRVLIWSANEGGSCQQAFDPLTFETYTLRDARGRGYVAPGAPPLPDGTRVRVTGYTDVTTTACFGVAMEVIDLLPSSGGDRSGLAVEVLPGPSPFDQDGNLLADAWELAFYGSTGQDPFNDPDGAGVSLLQRYLEGLDPVDAAAAAALEPVDLRPPHLTIEQLDEFTVRLRWRYPTAYADVLSFEPESTYDLGQPFYPGFAQTTTSETGEWTADVAAYFFDQGFFRLRLSLGARVN